MDELRLPEQMIGVQPGGFLQFVEHNPVELLHGEGRLLAAGGGHVVAQHDLG